MLVVATAAVAIGAGDAWLDATAKEAIPLSVRTDPASIASAAAAREQRQKAIVTVAPAPLPQGLPLRGEAGVDRWGYPTQWVDGPALRSLLYHERYADLTIAFEQLQAAFEADPRKEYWPIDAADAFSSAEPELLPQLAAWVQATPGSFAPYLARGHYWTTVAYARRGGRWTKDTHQTDMEAAAETAVQALADLDRAVELRPRLVAARRRQINAALLRSDGGRIQRAIAAVERDCPGCFQVRVTFLMALLPRWGGSWAAMKAYAAAAPVAQNPRLALLPGYELADRADALLKADRKDEALAEIEKACQLGDHADFLAARAEIQGKREAHPAALADLDRAVALWPANAEFRVDRARTRWRMEDAEGAARDLLEAMRTDATDTTARWLRPRVVNGLVRKAHDLNAAGRKPEALALYDLATALAPEDREVHRARAKTIAPKVPNGDVLDALYAAAAAAPDDFRAHQALDYGLAHQGRFQEIVTMWDAYLARHPEDGQAFLERGGAKHHLGQSEAAKADARRACELGVNEGCMRAR